MNDVICVELLKTSAGLGFSLDGGKASIAGDRPLLVKRVFKGTTSMQWILSQFSFCVQILGLDFFFFFFGAGVVFVVLVYYHLLAKVVSKKTVPGVARDCIC